MQAREDAQAAIHALSQGIERQAAEVSMREKLAMAYLRLGDACLAEKDHADRDCMRALEVRSASFVTLGSHTPLMNQRLQLTQTYCAVTSAGSIIWKGQCHAYQRCMPRRSFEGLMQIPSWRS
jgi:hypothetical protein